MPDELRTAFHSELERIDHEVAELFALVSEGLAGATDAFLADDREAARALVARDKLIDTLYHDIERLVLRQLVLQAPMAQDLRFLLAVLRIVPELERSGDLVEHIAQRATRNLAREITPRLRGLISQMGEVSVAMWQMVAKAYAEHDRDAVERLRVRDDVLDDLHVSLTAELALGKVPFPVAIEMALLGRFYERLGDHAVNVAARVCYLVDGT